MVYSNSCKSRRESGNLRRWDDALRGISRHRKNKCEFEEWIEDRQLRWRARCHLALRVARVISGGIVPQESWSTLVTCDGGIWVERAGLEGGCAAPCQSYARRGRIASIAKGRHPSTEPESPPAGEAAPPPPT